MCLAVIAHDAHPAFPLIVAANRDEFHARLTAAAAWWPQGIFAGRDLSAGGTWFGVRRDGRIALLTNYRDGSPRDPLARSRGELVVSALRSAQLPNGSLRALVADGDRYQGFNLVTGTAGDLHCASNRSPGVVVLESGIFGLSNHLLDSPWPKVERTKARIADVLRDDIVTPAAMLEVLDDRTPASDDELPDTGIGLERERFLSSPFIVGERYGTRSSSVLLVGGDGRVRFVERTFDPAGNTMGEIDESFRLAA